MGKGGDHVTQGYCFPTEAKKCSISIASKSDKRLETRYQHLQNRQEYIQHETKEGKDI